MTLTKMKFRWFVNHLTTNYNNNNQIHCRRLTKSLNKTQLEHESNKSGCFSRFFALSAIYWLFCYTLNMLSESIIVEKNDSKKRKLSHDDFAISQYIFTYFSCFFPRFWFFFSCLAFLLHCISNETPHSSNGNIRSHYSSPHRGFMIHAAYTTYTACLLCYRQFFPRFSPR